MELAPFFEFMTHCIRLRRRRHRDVMQAKNPVADLLTTGVQGREVLYRVAYPLERILVFYGRGITVISLLLWAHDIGNTLFDIAHLLFGVSLLVLYVAFCSSDHFCQWECWILGERLIKVSRLYSVLERPRGHFLVWRDDLDGGFIKPGEIVPKRHWRTLAYVEQTVDIFMWRLAVN